MMTGYLGAIYDYVKALHVIVVIFWMAGLFMLPRYLVYHQEGMSDPHEAARWIEREGRLRRIILTPAIISVWVLGLLLALNLGLTEGVPGLYWLHAKIVVVLLLSGFHAGVVWYSKKLAKGERRLPNKALRLLNEVPALAVTLIVFLVVVKPF